MFEIAAGVCLGILAAVFLLGTRIGQSILTLILLGVAALLIYLFWDSPIINFAKFVGAVLLFLIIIGWSWIGIKKLGEMLSRLQSARLV
jgi:hypothetical protein